MKKQPQRRFEAAAQAGKARPVLLQHADELTWFAVARLGKTTNWDWEEAIYVRLFWDEAGAPQVEIQLRASSSSPLWCVLYNGPLAGTPELLAAAALVQGGNAP